MAPELYREIILTDLCCQLPSKQVFGKMVERSGSRLTKITCNFKCRDLLKSAVIHCGNSLQEIHVEEPQICISLESSANMLNDIKNHNPTALVKIRFQNITFLLRRTAGVNKTLFERIHDLKISWNWTWMERKEWMKRTLRGDMLLEQLQDNIAASKIFAEAYAVFPITAMRNLHGLEQVLVTHSMVKPHQLNDETERQLMKNLVDLDASLCHSVTAYPISET